jgi:hypothetical protein
MKLPQLLPVGLGVGGSPVFGLSSQGNLDVPHGHFFRLFYFLDIAQVIVFKKPMWSISLFPKESSTMKLFLSNKVVTFRRRSRFGHLTT